MRPEDTELASGARDPVFMNVHVELMTDAPVDIKATWAIEQVMDNLRLTKPQRLAVLRFMTVREECDEPLF